MKTVDRHLHLTADTFMPVIGFGTYLISNDDTEATVKSAIDTGYRHVDTAEGYQNEQGVGAALKDCIANSDLEREHLFITTKLWPGNAAWGHPEKTGDDTIKSFEESLRKLQLDHVDLYLIHTPFAVEHRLDQWAALIELQNQGKVRSVGVSNFNEQHLLEISNSGLQMPDVNQIELHPWTQKPGLISCMEDLGIQATAYSSLAPLSTWRVEPGQSNAKSDEMENDDAHFATIADKYNVTEAQLLLRWGVQNGYAVLPKSMDRQRMEQNLDLFDFTIDDDDMAILQSLERGDGIAWPGGDPSLVS